MKGLIATLVLSICMIGAGVTVAAVSGCAAKGAKASLPPGALNQFDADTYNVLITAQAAINQAKATYGKEYYGSINIAIQAYNTALAAYLAWHTGAGGTQGAVKAAIAGMLAAVANMNKQQGIMPKPATVSDLGPPLWIAPIGTLGGA